MIPEDAQERKGEPVIIIDEDGRERLGTIEFGSVESRLISVYTERDGRSSGREIIRDFTKIRPDPGGERPCWARLRQAAKEPRP